MTTATARRLSVAPQHLDVPGTTDTAPTVSQLREAGTRAGWSVEKVAAGLGLSRQRLLYVQHNGQDVLPQTLVPQARALLRQAAAEEQQRRLDDQALSIALRTWDADVRRWERTLRIEGRRSAATITSYVLHLSWLAEAMAPTFPSPWSVHTHALEDWLASKPWSESTRRKALVSLRCFYTWGVLEGYCDQSPLAGIALGEPRQKPGPKGAAFPPAWTGPVRGYLDHLHAANRSLGTRRLHEYYLGVVASLYPEPWQITTEQLVRFQGRPDLAPETRKSMRTVLRGFYRWAEDTAALPLDVRNPASGLPAVKVPRALPRPAPDDAVLRGLEEADHRMHLALSIAVYTGLRVAEIARVHANDLGDQALLVHGKGGKQRLVPLHPALGAMLREELRRREVGGPLLEGWGDTVPHRDGWLFPSRWDQTKHLTPGHLSRLMSLALPGKWTAHTLRHRFGSQAYAADHDLRAVQELLGHSKPETTAVYAAVPGHSLTSAVAAVGPVTRPGRTWQVRS